MMEENEMMLHNHIKVDWYRWSLWGPNRRIFRAMF